jgi:hypothetical protein
MRQVQNRKGNENMGSKEAGAITMNQYEKQQSLDWIDGYWSPRPGASDKTLAEDFQKAKDTFRGVVEKHIENVNAITLDEFRKFKGPCFPEVVR